MPFVQGYFRSAPGGGGSSLLDRRRIDVAVYGTDGTTLLRDNTGGRWSVQNVTFSSTLPGGFATASFRLARPTARSWGGRAGLKVIIRRGNQMLWWGWIEDLRRVIRGATEYIDVTCIGPYQTIQQRLCSVDYSAATDSDAVLADVLAETCPEISTNYTQIAATGIDFDGLAWDNRSVAELVKLVCETGNSSGRPMLFAIWEPAFGTYEPTSAILNPRFNSGLASWSTTGAGWAAVYFTYHSLPYSVGVTSFSGGTYTIYQTVAALENTAYTLDFWTACTTTAGNDVTVTWTLAWKDSGGGAISTTTLTTHTMSDTTTWTRHAEAATSPANTASVVVTGTLVIPGTGGYCHIDDVYLYSTRAAAVLPQAHLWARDLTAADYQLYTAELDSALPVDTTTRELANNVIASYGASSYTAAAESTPSQNLYRTRDVLIPAGSAATQTMAEAQRDTYLARHTEPTHEPGTFRLTRPGPLRTAHSQVVWPEDVRAGDRIAIADGPLAGTVVLLKSVEYNDGVVTCTPERSADVPQLLARV